MAPTISGLFDGLTGLVVNPVWTVIRTPAANGTVTRDGVELVIRGTAAPFIGGYGSKTSIAPTHMVQEYFVYDSTNLTKRIGFSPTFSTSLVPSQETEAYFMQVWGAGNIGAYRVHGGVLTLVGSIVNNTSPLAFQINVELGTIYFGENGRSFASELYQIAPGPVYPYYWAEVGGAVPPLTALIDNFLFLSETP